MAAEVINHAPLILPQPKDAPRLPTSHPSSLRSKATKCSKKKDKRREKVKLASEIQRGETSRRKSGGLKKLEDTSSGRWNWTFLTDGTVSSHPPVFTRDGRSVVVIVVPVFHPHVFQQSLFLCRWFYDQDMLDVVR